ncbi:hypothetical protein IRJ41_021093 [Triplophysa rosa]|uniref:Uncharacterized protein n=1 Tax=Triplophysa rosa TaxID=992332 RepID=A0A9W7TN44_TRIRA|nr:hypothetical protein IRJ41_021093 [Triplophysa rosa]
MDGWMYGWKDMVGWTIDSLPACGLASGEVKSPLIQHFILTTARQPDPCNINNVTHRLHISRVFLVYCKTVSNKARLWGKQRSTNTPVMNGSGAVSHRFGEKKRTAAWPRSPRLTLSPAERLSDQPGVKALTDVHRRGLWVIGENRFCSRTAVVASVQRLTAGSNTFPLQKS